MRYLELRSTPECLEVSRLCLGTYGFGEEIGRNTAFALLDRFFEAGGTCVDTARVYQAGGSERTVGEWMRSRHLRERVVLSTKCCHPPLDAPEKSRLSFADMREDLARSLEALGTGRIDIWWIHKDDPRIPADEIVDAFGEAARDADIGALGCSNWRADRIAKANGFAAAKGGRGFSCSQIQWNVAELREEARTALERDGSTVVMSEGEYRWYLRNAMPVFAYGSQARGYFSKLDSGGPGLVGNRLRELYDSPANLARYREMKEFSLGRGIPVSAAALSYITCNSLPAVAIIGCRTSAQLDDSLAAADLETGFTPS